MQKRFSGYCLSTVLALVALRLTVGWHFYSEGSKHLAEEHWSSEGFLRAAKGPLAPWYQAPLGGNSDYNLAATLSAGQPADKASETWGSEVIESWQRVRDAFRTRYKLTDEQLAEVEKIGKRRQVQFDEWLQGTKDDFVEHLHQAERLAKAKSSPSSADVPFEKKRIDEAQAKLNGQSAGWVGQARSIEKEMASDLQALLTPEQLAAARANPQRSSLEKVDTVMKYGITLIGAGLLVGLLTRLWAFLGGMFLLSVVLSQPAWVAGTSNTYPQLLEMLVLFALATTPVGRWCGLDFFFHSLCGRSACSAKGKSDAPHS